MIITSTEVRQLIKDGDKLLGDKRYKLPSDEEVKIKVDEFLLKRGKFIYVDDFHDCDNCSLEMVAHMSGTGWAFGMAFIEKHCICVYINNNKEIKFIEPLDGAWIDQKIDLKLTFMV